MRFAKFLINFFYFIFTMIVLSLFACGISVFFTVQSGEDDAKINLWDTAGSDEEIASYQSAITFWATEIGNNFSMDPKYRVRTLFSWSWWQTGTYFIDLAVDRATAVVSPIIFPIWNVSMVSDHYIEGFTYCKNEDKDDNGVIDYSTAAIYMYERMLEPYYVSGGAYNWDEAKNDILISSMFENGTEYNNFGRSMYYYFTDYLNNTHGSKSDALKVNIDYPAYSTNELEKFSDWISYDAYTKTAYEYVYRVAKYNNSNSEGEKVYASYFSRFIDSDTRSINTSTYILYITMFISMIFSAWLARQFPADRLLKERLIRGENEVAKPSLVSRIRKRRK